MYDILLTCPPMIGLVEAFKEDFAKAGFNVTIPEMTQEMPEAELVQIIGNYDGWIIGDDSVTEAVLRAGKAGKLKACMRWGVGTNNVDFKAALALDIPIENTPGVFGREVGDLACHYVSALARRTYEIDREVKAGNWFKPVGQSLWAAKALIVGLGDIGRNTAKRLHAHDIKLAYYDPFVSDPNLGFEIEKAAWPTGLSDVDYVVFTAPLTEDTLHMFNDDALAQAKRGLRVVNVGRGPLVSEESLIKGLEQGIIDRAALDVFEKEPYEPIRHASLQKFGDRLIVGSHNGSNTREAVEYVSRITISRLGEFLAQAR